MFNVSYIDTGASIDLFPFLSTGIQELWAAVFATRSPGPRIGKV